MKQNNKHPRKRLANPEQTGFTVRQRWASRSHLKTESLSATQTRVNHARLGAPQLKFLTHIFAIFFHAMPCSPQSKTNSFWKLFRVLPTTKWNRADHILLYTRPPTTSLAVVLCLSWVSMRTATDSMKINVQIYLWNARLTSNPSSARCLW